MASAKYIFHLLKFLQGRTTLHRKQDAYTGHIRRGKQTKRKSFCLFPNKMISPAACPFFKRKEMDLLDPDHYRRRNQLAIVPCRRVLPNIDTDSSLFGFSHDPAYIYKIFLCWPQCFWLFLASTTYICGWRNIPKMNRAYSRHLPLDGRLPGEGTR